MRRWITLVAVLAITLVSNTSAQSAEIRIEDAFWEGAAARTALEQALHESPPVSGHPGKREFSARCSACHGEDGKGNGPYAGLIENRTPDLTLLSKSNGGVFPFERVRRNIAGRTPAESVSHRDCPVWDSVYRAAAAEAYFDVPYDPDFYVSRRVLSLTDYLLRIQVK